VDIVQVLTQQPDYQAARNYWKVLKNRLAKEGSQTVTNCNQLKLPADDGKMRLTDVANTTHGRLCTATRETTPQYSLPAPLDFLLILLAVPPRSPNPLPRCHGYDLGDFLAA